MKLAWDDSLRDTLDRDLDSDTRFDQVWRDIADDDEDQDYDIGIDCNDVRLECDGDFVDARTVRTIEVQKVMAGADLVRFVCPRCGKTHESLVLR